MALRVVENRSLADQVFEQLTGEILSGRSQPGTNLPAERKLVETFRVNRHVVREALKRLEQVGLVKVSQGGGTKVADFTRDAGLDLLALMADYAHTGEETMTYWLAVHEMRVAVAADVARLCALRGEPGVKREVLEIARSMKELEDGPELFALELRFWDRVLDGADNIAYRLAFNSLIKGVLAPAVADMARALTAQEIKETGYRMAIATAVAKGDGPAAASATREALGDFVEKLTRQVKRRKAVSQRPPAAAESARRPAARKRRNKA
jgi:GntR family transcriptional regulator, transcriptional repressor for pyruvate dehydrogenase complex